MKKEKMHITLKIKFFNYNARYVLI